MNTNGIARNYDTLTPQERFRLILAASGRGDEAERERLVNAGRRITLSLYDHSPHVCAFDDLARLVFIDLVEEAARYSDAWARADEAKLDALDDPDEGGHD